jgi:uncharacterized Fe-S cluster-containing radical SAM superfamily protein
MTRPPTHPEVRLSSLDTLWFQVGGTVCNLACTHCLVSSSPTNHTHEMLTLEQVQSYLEEAAGLGVKEYYFTGGEPFLNPEMESILAATLRHGPATVLSNGLLLRPDRCARLREIASATEHSFDLRISLDGYDAETNDPIRGKGSFDRVVRAIGNLRQEGINPVLTVTEACDGASSDAGRRRLFALLGSLGIDKPRLKILPLFRIGAEASRGGAYESWQRLGDEPRGTEDWAHLQCSSCRVVTDLGVWVCPILVNEPGGRMGQCISETLGRFPLKYSACWTCHVQGASCRT